jgi:hypothetical protein
MGNIVGTIMWYPTPRDQEILEKLRSLTADLSLAEAIHTKEYKEGMVCYGAENAGLWRTVISDERVDDFLRLGQAILRNHRVDDVRCVKMNLAM